MTTVDALPPPVIVAGREAVKAYLRSASAAEDALVERLLASAVGVAEAFLGQALIVRGFAQGVAADGRWHPLSTAPVQAVTAVSDAAGPVPAAAWTAVIDADGRGWVRVTGRGGPVTASARAGLAETWDALPAPVAQGAVMLAAHLFERAGDLAPPAAVAALWRPFRRMTLGGRTVA